MRPTKEISARYARFAKYDARGWSRPYERLARGVAGNAEVLAFLLSLPEEKRQPNLLFAAVRSLFGVPDSAGQLAAILRRQGARVRAVMLSRSTQTNEPARCAILLPLLAALPQPLALLEVGASAGLCLLPERYGYDYGEARLAPHAHAPIFSCKAAGAVPYPGQLPRIAWRAGLDLNPLDLAAPEDVAWLETLVWPEQDVRLANLRSAIEIARADPPRVIKGDLLTDLPSLMDAAPDDATLVVFHSAVLAYVPSQEARQRFAGMVRGSRAVWLSNEAPQVFPDLAQRAPEPARPDLFLLAIDGEPVAWTGSHGQSIDWFAQWDHAWDHA